MITTQINVDKTTTLWNTDKGTIGHSKTILRSSVKEAHLERLQEIREINRLPEKEKLKARLKKYLLNTVDVTI